MLALVLPLPEILFLAESMSSILELANQKEWGRFASLDLLALSTHLLLKEFINAQVSHLGGVDWRLRRLGMPMLLSGCGQWKNC